MARPTKSRHVEFLPEVTFFKPAGIPLQELEEVVLSVEELEAIRLKDTENLDQEECALRMKVSRPTFQRVLGAARNKIAQALVEGKAIRVEGGNYKLSKRRFHCPACDERFAVSAGGCRKKLACPNCEAKNLQSLDGADGD
jgi:predicted DNA-binding protein (UPF0251 family)